MINLRQVAGRGSDDLSSASRFQGTSRFSSVRFAADIVGDLGAPLEHRGLGDTTPVDPDDVSESFTDSPSAGSQTQLTEDSLSTVTRHSTPPTLYVKLVDLRVYELTIDILQCLERMKRCQLSQSPHLSSSSIVCIRGSGSPSTDYVAHLLYGVRYWQSSARASESGCSSNLTKNVPQLSIPSRCIDCIALIVIVRAVLV